MDLVAKGDDFEKKAEKKLNGWGIFGSKYEDAADLFDKAANSFKLAKSWEKAGSTYVKLGQCHLKSDSKHEAASAYVDAAHCYKKTSTTEAISCLAQAVDMLCDIGRISMAARYFKEIAELYESDANIEKSMEYYDKAADFFQNEDVTTSANQCKQKVAEFSARLEQYQTSIDIYEEIARQSLKNNLLNDIRRWIQHFSGTREYKLLADIAAAIDEEDVAKFTDAVKDFDSMTPLDSWKTTLLLRVKEKLKAKELEEDDLT
ncbi:ALPHA-SOLUBLE NSF ATTACHMENT PROTEIN [Salix koriyanagi]|uniref:ALPHA-SOLUBLE NSF ATTACHMENT PROTEIN n=1 Tax=Salix koriyanagi TaxID=2511006 RepID=A0A9Q0WJ34_9ROSI|nr:ALPHA-SOLUBLE NSF ATTACHMENT PROTEIN [Salix koriyanagi]